MSAWEPQEPPRDFAERVLARVREEERAAVDARAVGAAARPRARLARGGIALASLVAAAAAVVVWRGAARGPARGDVIAADRVQVAVGPRAAAVLERGAHVAWRGDDVEQSAGDVFYRVEPGAPFRVHTPAGDVTVKGTCFRVQVKESEDVNRRDLKSGLAGAALSALTFVAVYEGKVAVSHAHESATLLPGQTARSDASGVHVTGAAARAGDEAGAGGDEAYAEANRNLVASVKEYQDRLSAIEAEEKTLKKELVSAQQKLAAAESDGRAPAPRSEFDLTQDDWNELAKKGEVRARFPCSDKLETNYGPKFLNQMGLAPTEGDAIRAAIKHSTDRTWSLVRPLCAQALKGHAEIVDDLGMHTCEALVMQMERAKGSDVDESLRQVAEMRAGMRPMPAPGATLDPVTKMMLSLTGETKAIEDELTPTLGRDAAHRVTFAEEGCWNNSGWGAGPRKGADGDAP